MLLVTEFTNERGETYTVLQLLKRLRRAIIQIDGILFDHQERIEVLEIDVEKIKNNIDDIKEQLLNIINRVDIVENKVEIVEETLTTIETNISSIEAILNNHDGDILALNTLVTNITTELNELQGIVDSIPIVSASPLNGYIKIDGIDTPVFIGGGGSGGSGGGGEIIAHYTSEGDTSFYGLEKTLIEFDLPDADVVNISGVVNYTSDFIETITGNIISEGGVRIYGYDEDNTETLLLLLVNSNNNANQYKHSKNIYTCSISPTKCSSSNIAFTSSAINSTDSSSINPLCNGMATVEYPKKLIKIKMKIYDKNGKGSYPSKYYINSFDVICSTMGGNGGSGGSGESNSTVYATKLNTLTNNDLNTYKNIWTLPCPPSAVGEHSRFEYDTNFSMSVAEIDKIDFQCNIMGAEINLGEINVNSFEEDFIYMKINMIGAIRKVNETEYFSSSTIEVIISNTNTSTKTSRVLARLNSNRGAKGVVGVDDNIKFNMMFTGGEVADRNSPMARGMLKSFYDIKELI